MKKIAWILALLSSCAMGSRSVSMDSFYQVELDASKTQVVDQLGKPYAIRSFTDGSIEYEYIEKIKIGARDVQERRYFITLKNGQVVSKRVETAIPLPYGYDSYEMQTTQQLEPEGDNS